MSNKTYEKLVQEIGKLSVLELSQFVKELEQAFGVSAAMPMAPATSGVTTEAPKGAAQEEKSEYKVTLKDSGAEKIKVIKALRVVLPDLSLSDAKKAVEEVPTVLAESASKEVAHKMKKELEAAGAKVELS